MPIEMQKTPGAAWQAVETTGGGAAGPTGPTGPTGAAGGGGGLPTGWTQDGNNPANVDTNGGFLDLGAGLLSGENLGMAWIETQDDGGTGRAEIFAAVVVMSSLPTVDPAVSGQLWNDSGTLKVSA